jgi:hypothetical protein
MSLPNDKYKPSLKTKLGDFDNYEIYDLVIHGNSYATNAYNFPPFEFDGTIYQNPVYLYTTSPPLQLVDVTSTDFDADGVPVGVLTGNIGTKMLDSLRRNRLAVKTFSVQRYTATGLADVSTLMPILSEWPVKGSQNFFSLIIVGKAPVSYLYHHKEKRQFQWSDLLINEVLQYTAIAATTGLAKYSYWASNLLEAHPLVDITLDYREEEIYLKKGQPYTVTLYYPLAHTLTLTANLQRPYGKPIELVSLLTSNRDYKNSLPTPPPPPSGPYDLPNLVLPTWIYALPWFRRVFAHYCEGYPPHPNIINVFPYSPPLDKDFVALPAANGRWQQTPSVPSQIYPPYTGHYLEPSLPSYNPTTDPYNWHFKQLPDSQFGEIIMDSPRTLELLEKVRLIVLALEAETYATDPNDPDGAPRVANLGWMIDRLTKWAGIRRMPNGKFLPDGEAEKYKRQRLSNPKWGAGQFSDREWGNQGMAVPYLPTTYENGQRQDRQFDLVSSLPDLLLALHDQIDASQGIQHNGEIRLPIGGKVQSYPNQGAMLTDLALRVAEMEGIIERMLAMQIETSNSVRELFPGIGIPVASKSVSVQIGGKVKQIYYPAFQAGKGSVTDRLTALAKNIGIILGALMPRNTKDERMNPFERKPK